MTDDTDTNEEIEEEYSPGIGAKYSAGDSDDMHSGGISEEARRAIMNEEKFVEEEWAWSNADEEVEDAIHDLLEVTVRSRNDPGPDVLFEALARLQQEERIFQTTRKHHCSTPTDPDKETAYCLRCHTAYDGWEGNCSDCGARLIDWVEVYQAETALGTVIEQFNDKEITHSSQVFDRCDHHEHAEALYTALCTAGENIGNVMTDAELDRLRAALLSIYQTALCFDEDIPRPDGEMIDWEMIDEREVNIAEDSFVSAEELSQALKQAQKNLKKNSAGGSGRTPRGDIWDAQGGSDEEAKGSDDDGS